MSNLRTWWRAAFGHELTVASAVLIGRSSPLIRPETSCGSRIQTSAAVRNTRLPGYVTQTAQTPSSQDQTAVLAKATSGPARRLAPPGPWLRRNELNRRAAWLDLLDNLLETPFGRRASELFMRAATRR